MMIVVVGDGGSGGDGGGGDGGGGKYGTPRAGVIIYLAPEIGPADTAGRFNGRTMLELTKTKTKHQLGDFFFHFSFASFTFAHSLPVSFSLSFFLAPSFSLSSSASVLPASFRSHRRRGAAKVRTTHMRGPPMPSSVSFFSHQR